MPYIYFHLTLKTTCLQTHFQEVDENEHIPNIVKIGKMQDFCFHSHSHWHYTDGIIFSFLIFLTYRYNRYSGNERLKCLGKIDSWMNIKTYVWIPILYCLGETFFTNWSVQCCINGRIKSFIAAAMNLVSGFHQARDVDKPKKAIDFCLLLNEKVGIFLSSNWSTKIF